MDKLLVICGPTATGKTALALALARKFNGELVSADSRQVYKGMDIGTGKDRDKDIPIWMYDVVRPDEEFSVGHYQKLARQIVADIISRRKLPIVVGGTGLYIQSLTKAIDTAGIPPNTELRNQLLKLTKEQLQEKLQTVSRNVWIHLNTSDRNNPRRLIRKIEIAGSQYCAHEEFPRYDVLTIGLTDVNGILYSRVDKRVDQRVKQGIVQEISGLLRQGYTWNLPAMSASGYKEWKPLFDAQKNETGQNDSTLIDSVVQKWKFDEHGYVRRQLTWFKKQSGIRWFTITDPGYQSDVTAEVRAWYT